MRDAKQKRWFAFGVTFAIALGVILIGAALLRRTPQTSAIDAITETPTSIRLTPQISILASPTPEAHLVTKPTATPPSTRSSLPTPTPTLYVISEVTIVRKEPPSTPHETGTLAPTPLPEAIGRIQIPALGHDYPIVPVSWRIKIIDGQPVAMWETVNGAVGYIPTSAKPGEPGNTVLTGHTRGDGKGEFQNLRDLKPGDEIRLYDAEGNLYLYRVEQVLLLQEVGVPLEQRRENAKYMDPTEDTRLTLITCWPEWVYTHRVIVIAKPA